MKSMNFVLSVDGVVVVSCEGKFCWYMFASLIVRPPPLSWAGNDRAKLADIGRSHASAPQTNKRPVTLARAKVRFVTL